MVKRTNRGIWYYLWPFAKERYHLRTRLTPEQCRKQLKLHVSAHPGGRVPFPTYDAVAGWVSATNFRIQRDDNVFVTPCPMIASGQITPTDEGSRLVVQVGMKETGLTLICLWTLGWFVFLLIDLLTTLSAPRGGPPNFLFWVFGFLGYGILVLSRWQGRYDGRVLIRFLCEVLKAEEEVARSGEVGVSA